MLNNEIKIELLKRENKKLREQIEDLQLQLRLCDSELLLNYKRMKNLKDYIKEYGRTYPNGKQVLLPYKCIDKINSIINGC